MKQFLTWKYTASNFLTRISLLHISRIIGYLFYLRNAFCHFPPLVNRASGLSDDWATFFFVVKGPAADATDAPQPLGLLCNPVMKMISVFFFVFPSNEAPVE
jgi:hypothetical protein